MLLQKNGTAVNSSASIAVSDARSGLAAAHSFGMPTTSCSGSSTQVPPTPVIVGYPPALCDEYDDDLMELAERLERQYYSPKQQITASTELPPPQVRPLPSQRANEMTPPRPQQISMQQINETTPYRPIISKDESKFNAKPKSFKLADVFAHVTQSPVPANMHSAEADCLALMECVVKLSPQFIDWVQTNAVPFNQLN